MGNNKYIVDDSKMNPKERKNEKVRNYKTLMILNKLLTDPKSISAKQKDWLVNKEVTNADKLRALHDMIVNDTNPDTNGITQQFKNSYLAQCLEWLFNSNIEGETPWNKYQGNNNVPKEYVFDNPASAAFKSYRNDENAPIGIDSGKLIDLIIQGNSSTGFSFSDSTQHSTIAELEEIKEAVKEMIKICKHSRAFQTYYNYPEKDDILENE